MPPLMDLNRPYIETLIAPLMQPKRRWSTEKCEHCDCLKPLDEPHYCQAQVEDERDALRLELAAAKITIQCLRSAQAYWGGRDG